MDNLPIIQKYNIPKIINNATLEKATSLLSELNIHLDKITEHKEQKTKPLNEALKKIREDYKPFETELEGCIKRVKSEILSYITSKEEKNRKEEAKILAQKNISSETKIQKLSNITRTENKINTEQGKITFTTIRRYRIIDIKKVPIEYLIPNDVVIKQAMEQNELIPGIEYYEEKSLRNYR